MNKNADESLNDSQYQILINLIKSEAKTTREEIKVEIKQENIKLHNKIEEQNKIIQDLRLRCTNLENKYKALERCCRKNNLVIFGLEPEENSNICEYTLQKLNELLAIRIDESDVSDLYAIKTAGGLMVKINLISYLKKQIILKNAPKLKGTKIAIAQDLCPEDQEDKKILQTHLKLAKDKGYNARIKGFKLIINDDIYTPQQLRQTNTDTFENEPTELEIINSQITINSAQPTPTAVERFENDDIMAVEEVLEGSVQRKSAERKVEADEEIAPITRKRKNEKILVNYNSGKDCSKIVTRKNTKQ